MSAWNPWPRAVFAVVLMAGFLSFLGHNGHILGTMLAHNSDPRGYYQYLPAFFLDHDLRGMPYVHVLPNGNGLSVFNMGAAYLMAPFFLVAHGLALAGFAPADGQGWPYAVAVGLAAAVYAAWGCAFLVQVMADRFGRLHAAVAVLLLFGCTNLYHYTAMEPGMSHVYSFFLFAVLVRCTVRMHEFPDGRTLILLALTLSMIVLVRPSNGIVLLFPLLFLATDLRSLRQRLAAWTEHRRALAIAVAVAIAPWLPQLYYWKQITGSPLVFTYGTMGQGFQWLRPHLADVLWHPWNGWFLYTPFMLPVMAALLWMAVRRVEGARAVLVLWLLAWYIIASWWCWWLGGAFGHRGFVEYMALLAWPTAWLVQRIAAAKKAVHVGALAMAGLFAWANIGLSWNYRSPWDGPDWTMKSVVREYHRLLP
jgi:hypothetical protein